MIQKYQYTTIDTVLAKYHRDFRGLDINEGDAIEWIGEALGFMKLASASEEAIAFIEVKNYQAALPNGLHYIIQVAKNNKWTQPQDACCTAEAILPELCPVQPVTNDCADCNTSNLVAVDCHGELIGDQEVAYYRPYFDLQYEYGAWATNRYRNHTWTPITLSNHSFFNTLVCQTDDTKDLFMGHDDGYTIVEDQLRFSFKEGFIALAYLRQRIDCETGYPMIPDNEYAKAAITYYMVWKIKQREAYMHREGSAGLSKEAQSEWEKYIKKFKNNSKMPYGADQHQNLAEQSKYLIPRQNRYYGFFGKLGTPENRSFLHPNRRRYN